MHEHDVTAIFKALADKTRLDIVRQLAQHGCAASCGSVSNASPLSQPAMSHHFGKLVEAEVITEHKEGKQKYYRLNTPLLESCGIDVNKL